MLQHETLSYNNHDLTNFLVNLRGCRRYTILYGFMAVKQIRWRTIGSSPCASNKLRIIRTHTAKGFAGCSSSLRIALSVLSVIANRPAAGSLCSDDSLRILSVRN